MKKVDQEFKLKLRGKTVVFIDWANVYHWKDSLKKVVDLKKLYRYLLTYKEVKEINYYFGTLYERLIKNHKQVIVIYMYGSLGKEVWQMKRGIFKASILKLGVDVYKKMTPNRRSGA